jgi:hypothetical protein
MAIHTHTYIEKLNANNNKKERINEWMNEWMIKIEKKRMREKNWIF